MTLTFPIAPMKATLGSLPEDPDDGRWAYEIKWDGHRALVHVDSERVRVQSGGGHDVSERWNELLTIGDSINASSAVLDGEVVVFGADGRPSFDLVQRRHGRPGTSPATPDAVGRLSFQVFDVLAVDDTPTTGLSYLDRRRLLGQLLETGAHWSVPEAHDDGAALVAATAELGLEGVMAKRADSIYRVGVRSADWLKIKHRRIVELPIGGFTAGSGARSATFGALLLGTSIDGSDALRFAGGVGSGFDDESLRSVAAALIERTTDTCPFDPPPPRSIARDATWIEPGMTAQVEIAEFTNDGHVRHAVFRSLVDLS